MNSEPVTEVATSSAPDASAQATALWAEIEEAWTSIALEDLITRKTAEALLSPLLARALAVPGMELDAAKQLKQRLDRLFPPIRQNPFDEGLSVIEHAESSTVFAEAEKSSQHLLLSPGRVLRESPLRNATRIKTGLATLDRDTLGGLPVGSVTVMQGPPGAGKSTLAKQFGISAHKQGVCVFMLCADEGGSEPASRKVGQEIGLKAEDLEAGDEIAAMALDEWAANRFHFFAQGIGLREAIRIMRAFQTDALKVFVADTLQTVEFEQNDDEAGKGGRRERSERLRLTAAMDCILAAARTTPAAFIVCSEVARGAYASKDSSDWTSDIASGAETRAIEFRTDLLIFIREKGEGASSLKVWKNRPGRGLKPFLTLRHNRDLAVYTETDAPTASQERNEAQDRQRERASGQAQEALLAAMEKHLPQALSSGLPGLSENALARKAKLSRDKRPFQDALDALTDGQGIWVGPLPGPHGGNYYKPKSAGGNQ